jgi:hypothetical protein
VTCRWPSDAAANCIAVYDYDVHHTMMLTRCSNDYASFSPASSLSSYHHGTVGQARKGIELHCDILRHMTLEPDQRREMMAYVVMCGGMAAVPYMMFGQCELAREIFYECNVTWEAADAWADRAASVVQRVRARGADARQARDSVERSNNASFSAEGVAFAAKAGHLIVTGDLCIARLVCVLSVPPYSSPYQGVR